MIRKVGAGGKELMEMLDRIDNWIKREPETRDSVTIFKSELQEVKDCIIQLKKDAK